MMKASIFITCLIDQFAPTVGVSMARVLKRLGVELDFPAAQTCCGQPAFNSGFRSEARSLARRFVKLFESSETIVVPSGSCASMVKVFYPDLFKDDPGMRERALSLASRTHEFTDFLINVLGVEDVGASFEGKVALHQSCHLFGELGVKEEPERLLRAVRNLQMVRMERADACCGFGGLFSLKYPELSGAILQEKLDCITRCGADTLVACDLGCLIHIGGGLSRRRIPIKVKHIAELLASPR
jgi:L-lactate dehydrogenase complex protein LldE